MIDIVISKVQTTLFGKELFKDISLEVKQGEKIALLGDNGVGKTTLFRVLIGEENYQHGSLQVRKNAKIGYLKQKIKDYGSMTANDVLNSAFKEISHISKQIKDIEKKMTSNSEDIEKLLNKYGRLQEKYCKC